VALAAFVGGIAVAALAHNVHLSWGAPPSKQPRSGLWEEPIEFLYLDRVRLLNYLDQLERGEVGKTTRITKELAEAKAEASAQGLGVGSSSQREDEVESTLTPVASSRVWTMLEDLEKDHRHEIHDLELGSFPQVSPEDDERIEEGWLVDFTTRELLNPAYIRPYQMLHRSATLAALFPAGRGNPVTEGRAARQRRKAEIFAKQVGPNPPMAFAVDLRPGKNERRRDALKVLLPARYRYLVGERSMLEKTRGRYVGGELHVVGKVLRLFGEEEGEGCEKESQSECSLPAYTDLAAREAWLGPLQHAPHYLINHVSHSCDALPDRTVPKSESPRWPGIRGKHCYVARLKRQTRLSAPGMVILPVAIYK
jgi:hypothetical protein